MEKDSPYENSIIWWTLFNGIKIWKESLQLRKQKFKDNIK